MDVTRKFSREGHDFQPKCHFFPFLHKKEKNANLCNFSAFQTKFRAFNTSRVEKIDNFCAH